MSLVFEKVLTLFVNHLIILFIQDRAVNQTGPILNDSYRSFFGKIDRTDTLRTNFYKTGQKNDGPE